MVTTALVGPVGWPATAGEPDAGVTTVRSLETSVSVPCTWATTVTLYCVAGSSPVRLASGEVLTTTTGSPPPTGTAVNVQAG